MTSRAERRRKQRQQGKPGKSQRPSDDTGPLVDLVVRYGPPTTEAELEGCIDSLPSERLTVTVVAPKGVTPPGVQTAHSDDVTDGRRRAAGRGRAPFLVFMDADCSLMDKGMLDIALGHLAQGAGVVGGLLVTADVVHAAGYTFAVTGKPYRRYDGWSPDNERVQLPRADVQAVPFGFLATRRDVFRKVGLRPDFVNRPYSDVDYCVRVRKAGAPVIYDPGIRVETAALLEPKDDPAAVQLMLASCEPKYDEWFVL